MFLLKKTKLLLACKRTVNYLGGHGCNFTHFQYQAARWNAHPFFLFLFLILTPCEKTTQPGNMLLVFKTKLKLPELR